jgi:2-polyprenyl-3-methyl-5-hydroxy-6-metoxy-1,4-benzoquinol methylase
MEHCTPITTCLACGHEHLEPLMDLNDQPLANDFLPLSHFDTEPEVKYPLAVNLCPECKHVQLTHVVDPAIIYKHYLYVSGTSKAYNDYMAWYAQFVREQFTQWPTSVLDIGCNDGSQLDKFKELGFTTYGVDPAENLHATSSGKGHNVLCGFWNEDTAVRFTDKHIDVITSQNAFAHIPDPLSYLKLVSKVLSSDGLMFISTSQADMVVNGEFDTIYHEHISFYSANSMNALCKRAGLHLIDVVKTPIHGTSYVFVISKRPKNAQRMANILSMERAAGLENASTFHDWSRRCSNLVQVLKHTVEPMRTQGYKLVGYGAAAKGNTLLNFADLKLDVIIDDNPMKVGLVSPGQHIPVVGPEYLDTLAEDDQVVFIPLAWNFYEEIRSKILARRTSANDIFVKYFPEVTVLV